MGIVDFAKKTYRNIIRNGENILPIEYNNKEASDLIAKGITGECPFLCARLGCTELQTIIFARLTQKPIIGWCLKPFWKGVLYSAHNSSGIFGVSPKDIYKFADLYETLMEEIDILGSWHPSERHFDKFLAHKTRIHMHQIGPNMVNDSWLKELKGKKVLVVHPFAETIKSQYNKRKELFENPNILPDFQSLQVLKAVQSVAGEQPEGFANWFEALEYMRQQMQQMDYDVALLGCGAYGFPLAAWAKKSGRKAVLMGGSLQLLFGIKGRRWMGNPNPQIQRIMNRPSWVKPSADETPEHIERVPGSGYW